ncbi:MAG TPA: flagellar motor protein MotB [Bdellovibrionales bacterium]|nr:flagellar motor protein MotB [Bdellovibrionales bacterium]
MAEKKEKQPIIVVKKITINKGGHHGGSWKVAFADFMTAMMCFFLVMWLVVQPEEVKKQVASHFSGPTVIEQQLSAYGAEITLEKLFLDLINEPLKAFQAFVQPADLTPDLFSLGTKKVVLFHIAHELGDIARNVEINQDEIRFDIPENYLFEKYSSKPAAQFVTIMEKVRLLTTGLEHANVELRSTVMAQGYPPETHGELSDIANARLDLVKNQVASSFENSTNNLRGDAQVSERNWEPQTPAGYVRFHFKQKEALPEGLKPRKLRGELGGKGSDASVYDEFVNRMSESQRKKKRRN